MKGPVGSPRDAMAVAASSLDPAALQDQARAHYDRGDWAKAWFYYSELAKIVPASPILFRNIARCLMLQQEYARASTIIDEAILLDDQDPRTWRERGFCSYHLGDIPAACAALQVARRLAPADENISSLQWTVESHRAIIDGRYRHHWEMHEQRWRYITPPITDHYSALPRWRGAPIDGELLVYAEQGLGDVLMLLRWLDQLPAEIARDRLVLAMPPALRRLVAAAFPRARLIGLGEDPGPDVCQACPMMSLPLALSGRVENIPPGDGLRRLLPPGPKAPQGGRERRAIGLVWSGNPVHLRDRERSIPFETMRPLLDLPHDFVSLNPAVADGVDGWALPSLTQGVRPDQDLLDTARVMAGLDLVITIDSAPAHLAGCLGVPVWTLVTFIPDWRWGLGDTATPWYRSMRLFRQPRHGDWNSVINHVAEQLGGAGARPSPDM